MKIEHLEYIIEIVNTGSLNLAAKNLYITQSSLSKSLNALEEELGTDLFIRSSHGMVPTDFCREILGDIYQVLQVYNSIKMKACTIEHSIVQILAPPLVNHIIIAPVLAKLRKKYPKVKVSISSLSNVLPLKQQETVSRKSLYDFLSLSNIPIIICTIPYIINEEFILKYKCTFLYSDTYCIYLNKSNAMAKKQSLSTDELKEQSIISYKYFVDIIFPLFYSQLPDSLIQFDSIQDVFCALHDNLGISFLSKLYTLTPSFQYKEELCILPCSDYDLTFYHYLFTLDSLSSQEKNFINLLKKQYREIEFDC